MYPSTTIKEAIFFSRSLTSYKPNNSFDLLKKEVSGELRYLGSPSSMILPPMAIKSPLIFLMGKITLPLNRS